MTKGLSILQTNLFVCCIVRQKQNTCSEWPYSRVWQKACCQGLGIGVSHRLPKLWTRVLCLLLACVVSTRWIIQMGIAHSLDGLFLKAFGLMLSDVHRRSEGSSYVKNEGEKLTHASTHLAHRCIKWAWLLDFFWNIAEVKKKGVSHADRQALPPPGLKPSQPV